jgi:hypothetical protein
VKEIPKRVSRVLRQLAATAYQEELRRALIPLAEAFDAWKSGEVHNDDLLQRIHAFDHGPAHELSRRYDRRLLKFSVAQAITSGIIKKQRVPREVLDHLAGALEFCTNQQAES